ncbi:MAG: alpha/beta hydrolase [bacterium]|nr:alpha/beta hydrolase [bacterium]
MKQRFTRQFILLLILAMVPATVFCDEPAGSDNNSDMICEEFSIPVKLSAKSLKKHTVVGTLCRNGDLEGKPLYMLISGSTYGPSYWDFPIQADTYSYVRAAAKAGFATFNLSRIGIGRSDHPFGLRVDVDANAYVVHQVIEYLRNDANGGLNLGPVVTMGHSLGSVITVAHAVRFPQDIDGVILTGFIHNINPDYGTVIREASYSASSDPRFEGKRYDFSYITSIPGDREIFYVMDQTDPDIVTVDELTKETTTVGEIASTRDYYGEESLQITVPVLQLIGDEDIVGCGGGIDCHDQDAVIAHEQQFFSDTACIETHVIENTGHNLNLHRNAPSSYQLMFGWTARRIGAGMDVSPADPCSSGL